MKRRRFPRRTQCEGKVRHSSRAAALAHRARLLALGRAPLDVYKCRHCGFHHVGHNRKR